LESFDQATEFLLSLNRLLLALGAVTLLVGAGLIVLISNAVTRPLGKLVNGVHALQQGDYSYPLIEQGSQEVAELTGAFRHMRDTLQKTQQELLHAERMAMIGQMAGSISHDMRHQLSAIFANAEFLCSTKLTAAEREELFSEIRFAVNEMTELVDSMLEFSRTQQTLHAAPANLVTVLEHAIRTVKSHPEYRNREITLYARDLHEGYFDPKRLERAFYNLLLNAVEAVSTQADDEARVQVIVMQDDRLITTRIIDNGPGIPSQIETTIFDPFVGFGKEHGTGLGLTIARKILQDHGGDVEIESGAKGRTIFVATVPVLGTRTIEENPAHPKTSITKPEA
jgi:signal transduction histidine kinase